MKRAINVEVPRLNAVGKRQRRLNKPTRVMSLTTVDISRALRAIPGELGALLPQKILEKRIDGDQLLDLLNSVEAPEEEPVVTDVFCKHSDLLLPYLQRVPWDRLCSMNRQIYDCSRSVTPLWPQKLLQVGSPIISMAFSSDGEWLACGSDDGTVRLWNGRNGNCTLLEGHTQAIECVAFSPNEKMLASGSQDHLIRLWKLDDQSHRLLEGHNGGVESIAFSPSGSLLASVSFDVGEVRLWDIKDGRCTRIITTNPDENMSVAFSPVGATLAVGGFCIRLWDKVEADDDSNSPSRIIETNDQAAHSLVYSLNGSLLASVWEDTVSIWRVSDGSLVNSVKSQHNGSATLSPNGKLVATGCEGGPGVALLWSINDGAANILAGCPYVHCNEDDNDDEDNDEPEGIISLAFATNGQTLATGGEDGNIFLWDTRKFL